MVTNQRLASRIGVFKGLRWCADSRWKWDLTRIEIDQFNSCHSAPTWICRWKCYQLKSAHAVYFDPKSPSKKLAVMLAAPGPYIYTATSAATCGNETQTDF